MTYPVLNFVNLPIGAEALPPEGSDYTRAIYLPESDDSNSWVLISGEGTDAVITRALPSYLSVSGFTPTDRLGLDVGVPIAEGDEEITVRISAVYQVGQGVTAWSALSQINKIVSDESALAELVRRDDPSALLLLERHAEDLAQRVESGEMSASDILDRIHSEISEKGGL